jgi:translation initiation factor 3 subunit M
LSQLASINDVEEHVIDAVSSGLVDAKLDQGRQLVFIQRVTARDFHPESWRKLGTKLDSWKKNVRDVMRVLAEARNLGKV